MEFKSLKFFSALLIIALLFSNCKNGASSFIEQNLANFSVAKQTEFIIDREKLKLANLKEITDSKFINSLFEKLKSKEMYGSNKYYFYSNESRCKQNQDFTIIGTDSENFDSEQIYLYYVMLDKTNEIIDVTDLASDIAVGDYAEETKTIAVNDSVFNVEKKIMGMTEEGEGTEEVEKYSIIVCDATGRLAKETSNEMKTGGEAEAGTVNDKMMMSGEWIWQSENKNQEGVEEAYLTIKIVVDEGKVTGGFGGHMNFGARVESGEEDYACPLSGEITKDGAELVYESCYSDNKGKVKISLVEADKLKWTVTEMANESYVPAEVILVRKTE